MPLLDPAKKHPMTMPDGTVIPQVVHLDQVIDHPRIAVGVHSYYHDFEVKADYAATIAPYLFPFSSEKLIIGKFVQIAHGVRFITSSANHQMDGFSTYPFWNFMMTPETSADDVKAVLATLNDKGDTVIGNDVWLGMDAMVMPGVAIGDGAIVAARAVVVKDIPPYSIVVGNPGRIVKSRFSQPVVEALLEIRWWDWPLEKIEANLAVIQGSDIEGLRALA